MPLSDEIIASLQKLDVRELFKGPGMSLRYSSLDRMSEFSDQMVEFSGLYIDRHLPPLEPHVTYLEYLIKGLQDDLGETSLFKRVPNGSSDSWNFDDSWSSCHKAFKIFVGDIAGPAAAGLEFLSQATHERLIADSAFMIRFAACVRQLLQRGEIEVAGKICDACEFTLEERAALYRLALTDCLCNNSSAGYVSGISWAKQEERTAQLLNPKICAQILGISDESAENQARSAYFASIDAHSMPTLSSDLSKVRAKEKETADLFGKCKLIHEGPEWRSKQMSELRSHIANDDLFAKESAALAEAITFSQTERITQLAALRNYSLQEPALNAAIPDLSRLFQKFANGELRLSAEALCTIATQVGIPEALQLDTRIREKIYLTAVDTTDQGDLKLFQKIIDTFQLSDFPRSEEIERRFAATVVKVALSGNKAQVEQFNAACAPLREYIDLEVQKHFTETAGEPLNLQYSPLYQFTNLADSFGIPNSITDDPGVLEFVQKAALRDLAGGRLDSVNEWRLLFPLSQEFLTSAPFYEAAARAVAHTAAKKAGQEFQPFLESYPLPQSSLDATLPAQFISAVLHTYNAGASRISATWPHLMEMQLDDYKDQLSKVDARIVSACNIATLGDLRDLVAAEPLLINYLTSPDNTPEAPCLTPETCIKAAELGVPLIQAELFLKNGLELDLFSQHAALPALTAAIHKNPQMEVSDTEGLIRGINAFGAKYMVEFLTPIAGSNRQVNIHAPLNQMDAIVWSRSNPVPIILH